LFKYGNSPDTPFCLKDLIISITTKHLPGEIGNYYKTYVLSYNDYYEYIVRNGKYEPILKEIIIKYPEFNKIYIVIYAFGRLKAVDVGISKIYIYIFFGL
jgi:hypothetical protein